MTHEFDGRRYERASAHQKEWGTKLIAELGLQGAERVLDLGCGDGALTAQIADLLPRGTVVGIDASQRHVLRNVPSNQRLCLPMRPARCHGLQRVLLPVVRRMQLTVRTVQGISGMYTTLFSRPCSSGERTLSRHWRGRFSGGRAHCDRKCV